MNTYSIEIYFCHQAQKIPDIWPTIKPQHTCLSLEDALTFGFSKLLLTQYTGGTVRLADSTTFKISTEIAAAELFIEPWALRAFHWHPNQDEWQFYLGGSARVTLFAADGNAQTFDFEPGDVGFVPSNWGHYIFNTDILEDISSSQWLANF
ncbi:hypothetical protein ABKN59_006330 [Abortiporus biennis]